MTTKVQKWGNSLGIRIPKPLATEAKVEAGTAVDISVESDSLVIRPLRRRKYVLSELLEGVSARNLHKEVETRRPVGKEVW